MPDGDPAQSVGVHKGSCGGLAFPKKKSNPWKQEGHGGHGDSKTDATGQMGLKGFGALTVSSLETKRGGPPLSREGASRSIQNVIVARPVDAVADGRADEQVALRLNQAASCGSQSFKGA